MRARVPASVTLGLGEVLNQGRQYFAKDVMLKVESTDTLGEALVLCQPCALAGVSRMSSMSEIFKIGIQYRKQV